MSVRRTEAHNDATCSSTLIMSCSLLVQVLGQRETLAYEAWPAFDETLLISDTFNLPIQVVQCFPVSAVCVRHR